MRAAVHFPLNLAACAAGLALASSAAVAQLPTVPWTVQTPTLSAPVDADDRRCGCTRPMPARAWSSPR